MLCHDLDVAELIVASGGNPSDQETLINFGLPRVREMFGDSCLVRPGDRVVAVGRGRNEERALGKFVIRRQKSGCASTAPFALYALLDHPLDSAPLFFAFDAALVVGDVMFTAPADLKPAPLPPDALNLISRVVKYTEDFRIESWVLPGASTGTVVQATRRQPSTEDDRLPAMVLAVFDGVHLSTVLTENVDLSHGSGRFGLVGVSDFNSDGNPEIIVDGVRQKCPFRAIFTLDGAGWLSVPLPVKRCGC